MSYRSAQRVETRRQVVQIALLFVLGSTLGAAARADGVIEINQAHALAGEVTPGDAPGFPVEIRAPGSYRLTGSLTVSGPNVNAIEVQATDVSLDLNGFTLHGPVNCQLVKDVPTCEPGGVSRGILGGDRVSVRNGIISGFALQAIFLGRGARIEDVTAHANGGPGIHTLGDSRIEGCIVHLHENSGIIGQEADRIESNAVSRSGGVGIVGSDGVSIVGNSVRHSTSTGIQLLDSVDSDGGAAVENAVLDGGGDGIFAHDGSLVRGNSMRNNGGFGLILLTGGGYLHNNLDSNSDTVAAEPGSQLGANVCNGDTTCP